MSKNIVIILLSILVVAFGGFIVYDKFINESTNNIVNNGNVNGNNNKKDNNVYTDNVKLSQFVSVIESELSGIEAFNSLNEVSNENKLILLYNLYKKNNKNTSETFKKSDLEQLKENSSLANIDITYDNICDMYGIYTIKKDIVGYKYDSNTETYTYTGELGHGGVTEGIIYKKLIDYRYQDGKYVLEYNYIFYNGGSLMDKEDTDIYYTVTDLFDGKSIKTFNNNKNELAMYNKFDAISYIKNNYSELESKLKTFTYEFEIINNKIVLSNYYVK